MSTTSRLNSRSGVTLGEVMVAMAVSVITVTAILNTVIQSTRVTYMTAQQVAAFQVCKDTFEQMQGSSYDTVDTDHYPTQTNYPFCYLNGSKSLTSICQRTCEIVAMADPPRKDVRIEVAWTFWGKPLEHVFCGTIYRKETRDNAVVSGGIVGGTVNINPNNSSAEFTLVKADDGEVLTLDDFDEDSTGFEGNVTQVHMMPKGGGTQAGLTLDGQPYALSNNNVYDITSSCMNVRIWNTHVNVHGKATGQWMITFTASAADSVITMR